MMFKKAILISFISSLALALASALCPAPAFALFKIDFDQRYLHENNWVLKDFALFKADSTFHVFYTRGLIYSQGPLGCDSIGHATSVDLKHWTIQPRVLAVRPGTWESGALWAPFIMDNPGGGYLMYYTGADSNAVQRIGIATSDDLFIWTRHSGNPVFRPDTSWARWDSLVNWSACRDPHIYYEDGTYYMLYTATTKSGNGAIGTAVSTDLFNWTDNGPMYVHSGTYAWHAIESVFLLKRTGLYRLFFAEETSPPGVSYLESASMYSGWTIGDRQVIDPGIAPEILNDNGVELIARFGRFMKGDTVNYAAKVDTLRWVDDAPTLAGPHPLSQYWAEFSGSAVYYLPTFMDNSWERGSQHAGFKGNSWAGTSEYFMGPLQSGWAGWSVGDDAIGYMKSHPFVVEGDTVSVLVGGGNRPVDAYVALYRSSDDSLLFKETGKDTDTMDRRVWNVRPFVGQSVYFKVVDNATGTWGHVNCDEIEEYYADPDTIPPLVGVTAPNGGELFFCGLTDTVRWTATDLWGVDSVSVYYSTDGGASFPYTIATGESNDGELEWLIPTLSSTACVMKVVAYDLNMNVGSDTSDGVFTIVPEAPPSVTVVRPNGGETFYATHQDTVRWVAEDDIGVDSVSIYYSTDGGGTFPYVVATGEPNDSVYLWNVPDTPSADCVVKVVAYDTWENSSQDVSDAVFTVAQAPPSVTVVRPNGGEVFYVALSDTIRWVAAGDFGVDSVSIYYSTDGGATFPHTIATGEPNDSIYLWNVPDTPSAGCVVKVVAYDSNMNVGVDASDAAFRIISKHQVPALTPLCGLALAAGLAVLGAARIILFARRRAR